MKKSDSGSREDTLVSAERPREARRRRRRPRWRDEAGRRPKLLYESEHNRKITWDDMLRQTSDWEGTLWGKPEWADRPDNSWITMDGRRVQAVSGGAHWGGGAITTN